MLPKDRISALHDDLLLKILSKVPTKEAVSTMILSKRWGLVWTMVPKLEYMVKDTRKVRDKSVWCFLDKSLQLHKAPVLESLRIKADHYLPDDADVGKWVSYAVDRFVGEISLSLPSKPPPHQILLPHCLYTCKTLVKLTLSSCMTLVVDVPHLPCLPSLQSLSLAYVVYKDQDSHVRLLSSCHVLNQLFVMRENGDNVTRFSVKVPSLKRLTYIQNGASRGRNLVLDSPGLSYLKIFDPLGDYLSIQNTPRLDVAVLDVVTPSSSHPNDKFLTSFSSVMFLSLILTKVACCSAINFSRLIELRLRLFSSECWLEPLMLLLHNSPKLKVLRIISDPRDLRLSWNQPSSVPICLLSHLEIFEWKRFRGRREEKQFVAYILANSKCLKTVGFSRRLSCNDKEIQEMKEDLESMYRVSASSQLMVCDHFPWRSREW